MSPGRRPRDDAGRERAVDRELDAVLLRLAGELEDERGDVAFAEPPARDRHVLRDAPARALWEPRRPVSRSRAAEPGTPDEGRGHLDMGTLDALRAGTLGATRARQARVHLAGCLACLWAAAAWWSGETGDAASEDLVASVATPGPAREGSGTAIEALAAQLSALIRRVQKERAVFGSDPRERRQWARPAFLTRAVARPDPSDPETGRTRAIARRRALTALEREADRQARRLAQARELEVRSQAVLDTLPVTVRLRWERTLAPRWDELLTLLGLPPTDR